MNLKNAIAKLRLGRGKPEVSIGAKIGKADVSVSSGGGDVKVNVEIPIKI